MSLPARKPYRKASDYLGTNTKPAVERNPSKSANPANDALNNHAHVDLKRKIEILTAEFEQRREYLENELQISHRNQQKTEEQIKNLQASYISLQQKNVTLEEQLDKMVYVEKENEMLNREIEGLTNKLSDSKNALRKAQEDNERLRKDCNAAVQLLKCHPSNFQAPQQNKLPIEIQEKVETYKVQAQDYHEYINPYDDSDSDSDQEDLKPSSAHRVEPQLPHPAQ
uniref:Lebercilin domain-containing protein n=1 Tax=Ciona savignyi TaxID=51511 RepID=H2ZNW8_CIOSA